MTLGHDVTLSIKASGWRQGSVLPTALIAGIDGLPPNIDGSQDLLIVVSHDCDVTNSDIDAEPYVEIVPARVVADAQKDGNRYWGKNPRRYQFSATAAGQEVHFEICVHDMIRMPRTLLAGHVPDSTRAVNSGCVRSIVGWIAKRYVRASFPDAFNNRTKQAANDLRKQLKRNGHLLTGIYMLVQDDELNDGDDYNVTIWAAIRDEVFDNPRERQEAQKLLDQIESRLGTCAGVSIDASELRPEREVSLSDLALLKRWDFDDLSLREASEIPPAVL